MIVYGLKSCDKCRKTLQELRENGHNPHVVDVRADGVDVQDLMRFHNAFGDALINKRSTTWRGLSVSEGENSPLELLRGHPALMKRPVIEVDGQLYLGWDKETRRKLLG